MKRTCRFVEPCGVVVCTTESGEAILLPVFAGILKHPTAEELGELPEGRRRAVAFMLGA